MKKKGEVNIKVDVNEDGDVKVTVIPDEVKNKIPRPGDSIYIIEPYPVVDPEDVDGVEILEDDVKGPQILGYSYAPVMVRGSVLTEDNEAVMINGDYRIPLYKNSGESGKKMIVETNEEKAIEKFRTLMNVSLDEVKRRKNLYDNIQANLKESLEKLFH